MLGGIVPVIWDALGEIENGFRHEQRCEVLSAQFYKEISRRETALNSHIENYIQVT